MSKLVIVESPAKARTIEKYLGPNYSVIASMGHIRDLPKSLLGVDIENDFKPRYTDIAGKTKLIREIKAYAKNADEVILATDPDREGEAISWHLAQILNLDLSKNNRIVFNEITKSGVKKGIENPRKLDMNLVNAQQARRILDRIVGYKLSPFLWKKIRKGLSAGRVQSVAVRLIVTREDEIRAFVSDEYWSITGLFSPDKKSKSFEAKFFGDRKGKIEIKDKSSTDKILDDLKSVEYIIEEVKKGVRNNKPSAPFITSTLQQEASRRMGYASRKTMQIAQELYEGVEIPEHGATGLITYMRTDSLRISDEARTEGCEYIEKTYGAKYLPPKPHVFSTKAGSQDAHEAIRPTMPSITPESIQSSLSSDQYKLYRLIWRRFMASLMSNCVHDTLRISIGAGDYIFRASGYTVNFDGYTVLYIEAKDDEDDEDKKGALPVLSENQKLICNEVKGNQHFTQPPPRYTEATLIKAMEENGIGRPSTYAPTISTIIAREYVEREAKALKPTNLGEITTKLLTEHFDDIIDTEFTANMEEQLDKVDAGETDWVKVLDEFYKVFNQDLINAEKNVGDEKIEIPDEISDEICELCGKNMIIKSGRYGKFLACPGYPDCKNTKKIIHATDGICPKCGGIVVRKETKRRRPFYGCSTYPDCDFVTWSTPVKDVCPRCKKTMYKKKGKNTGIYCISEGCGYDTDNSEDTSVEETSKEK